MIKLSAIRKVMDRHVYIITERAWAARVMRAGYNYPTTRKDYFG